MNQDGSDQHLLSPDAISIVVDWQPAWSPDGTQIAFASTRPTGEAWHIWVMNADGTSLHQLAGNLSQHPAWSPDGVRIAGGAGNGQRTFDGTSSALYAIDADGSGKHQVSSDGYADYEPSWSPDGTNIVFTRRAAPGGYVQLYTVGAGGGPATQLLSSVRNDMGPGWGSSTVSPTPSAAASASGAGRRRRLHLRR